MRKNLRKIMTIMTALLFVLPILLIAACSVEPRSEADVIPDALGTAEGLWLYKENYRTRTDGTAEEPLLTSVTVGETEYGADEFKIVSYKYVKKTCEIFFIIQIGEDLRVCHYNYMTKVSSDLFNLPDTETPRDYDILASDSLVYVKNSETYYGVIFSTDARLLYDDFYGTLSGDIVYRCTKSEDVPLFEYIRDGIQHLVLCDDTIFESRTRRRYGNYVYFLDSTAYAVDLESEELFPLFELQTPDREYDTSMDCYYYNGVLYVLACAYSYDNVNNQRFYRFFRIEGASATLVYDFGNNPYGMVMYVDGSTVYLNKDAERIIQQQYFAYDCNKGSMKRVTAGTVERNGKRTQDLEEEEEARKTEEEKRKEIGDYTFFVTSIDYDDEPQLLGSAYTKTCYYLIRKHGDKEEVMQYSLNGNRGHFFDDIREF